MTNIVKSVKLVVDPKILSHYIYDQEPPYITSQHQALPKWHHYTVPLDAMPITSVTHYQIQIFHLKI